MNESYFEAIEAILSADASVLRRPVLPRTPLYVALRLVFQQAAGDSLEVNMRGTDFLPPALELTEDQQAWLQAHPRVGAFNRSYGSAFSEKNGRLAAVVAVHPGREEIARLLRSAKYPTQAHGQEHVARLLTHEDAPACQAFGLALIEHYRRYERTCLEGRVLAFPASVDGNTAFQFYTYGPYVLQLIGERGGDFDAFMALWAMKRTQVHEEGVYLDNAAYPGIEGLYADEALAPNLHYLSGDGASLSHRVVDLIARKAILPTLLAEHGGAL